MDTILDYNLDSFSNKNLLEPATKGQRFVHLIVDFIAAICCAAFMVQIFVLLNIIQNEAEIDGSWLLIPIYAAFFSYYIVLEHYWKGKTLGKYMTQTHVVRKNGDKPSFGQILGRNIGRIIPFDGISYLLDGNIHDSVSGTMVVQD